MDTTAQLSENSHQGFEGIKAGLCLASMEAKSNDASGMPVCLWRNGIRSRSSGKERDAETGLDYFGARYYSGAMGRWTSPDEPFADQHPEDPQSWNLYAYVRNNPLSHFDTTGRADECSGVSISVEYVGPIFFENREDIDQGNSKVVYKSGIGVLVTITFTDNNGNAIKNMDVLESNVITIRQGKTEKIEETHTAIPTNKNGKIDDRVARSLVSSEKNDFSDKESENGNYKKMAKFFQDDPNNTKATQTLIFILKKNKGRYQCQSTWDRTLSNMTDHINLSDVVSGRINEHGNNYDFTYTEPTKPIPFIGPLKQLMK
jgi:RHS repeat-associated protein